MTIDESRRMWPGAVADMVSVYRAMLQAGMPLPMGTMAEQCAMAAQGQTPRAVAIQAALILEGKRGLLTLGQTKLSKAAGKTPYINRGLTLSPADEAAPFLPVKRFNMCHGATAACRFACVGAKTGQGALPSSGIARAGRTVALHLDPDTWWEQFDRQITKQVRYAFRKDALLAFRMNVASDREDLAAEAARRHPAVRFYDYTAKLNAMRRDDGVERVYSLKDGARRRVLMDRVLGMGKGCAVVFAVPSRKRSDGTYRPLPTEWNGVPVIDGDLHDLWFLQKPETGPFIVGLRVKGDKTQVAAAIESGFAVEV